MRVAILADPDLSVREQPLLTRLAVGLIDEVATVAIVEPVSVRTHPPAGPVHRVLWQDQGPHITLSLRVDRLIQDLTDRNLAPEVVHAFGVGAWTPALRLARRAGAALVHEVDSKNALDRAPAAERAAIPHTNLAHQPNHPHHPKPTPEPDPDPESLPPIPGTAFVSADPALDAPLRHNLAHLTPTPAHWGVHRGIPRPPKRTGPDRPTSVCVITDPNDSDAALTVLHAIARLDTPAHTFIDEAAVAGSRGKLWQRIEKLNLHTTTDIVPNLEAHRDLTLRCDVLALPGPTHRQRSIVLDAMAARLAVVADPDEFSEPLGRRELFRATAPRDTETWASALASAAAADRQTDPTIDAAARYADDQRRPSAHIEALIRLYSTLIEPAAISFTRPNAAR